MCIYEGLAGFGVLTGSVEGIRRRVEGSGLGSKALGCQLLEFGVKGVEVPAVLLQEPLKETLTGTI